MILVNNPGSWAHIYPPLEHASWHGLTPTDLVFPFFLFAVGNALSFVMPRLETGGDGMFWKQVIKRSLLIYFIGLFLTWCLSFRGKVPISHLGIGLIQKFLKMVSAFLVCWQGLLSV